MEPLVRRLGGVKPAQVEWLWPGRIPKNKLTMIGGEFGMGKSLFVAYLASMVSRGGMWPDFTTCPQGRVLMLCSEDDLKDTIVPRLLAADADMEQIMALEGWQGTVEKVHPNFNLHSRKIYELCLQHKPMVALVDPITSYLGVMDTNALCTVRKSLERMIDLAKSAKVTIIFVHHFNKQSSEDLRYRFSGTQAFNDTVRSCMAVMPGKRANIRRVEMVKHNLCRKPQALEYEIVDPGKIEWRTNGCAVDVDAAFGGSPFAGEP